MPTAMFPYVLMRAVPPGRTVIASLTERIHIALIRVSSDGSSKVLFREDIHALGKDPGTCYLDSRERLSRLVKARMITMRPVLGPGNVRCLAIEHSFLAASCAVLPNLFQTARRRLRTELLCLAMPRREVLLVMPNLGAPFRKAVRELLCGKGVTPDGCTIFSLDPSGPGNIHGRLPIKSKSGSTSMPPYDTLIPVDVEDNADTIPIKDADKVRCA